MVVSTVQIQGKLPRAVSISNMILITNKKTKAMKTKVIFISLFLAIIAGNAMAQDANLEYTNAMNNIFAKVDKSKITTGLLADYGVQIVDVEINFNTIIL